MPYPLLLQSEREILISMDRGQIIYMVTLLALGALAAFFAILLWSRTRDIAWMLMVIGTIVAYVETVYSILVLFGITGTQLSIGSIPVAAILLPNLRTSFFVASFVIMVVRKLRRH